MQVDERVGWAVHSLFGYLDEDVIHPQLLVPMGAMGDEFLRRLALVVGAAEPGELPP